MVVQRVCLPVLKPAEARLIDHTAARHIGPVRASRAHVHVIRAITRQSRSARHHRAGLNSIRRVEMHVVQVEAERILFSGRPVDLAEGCLLVRRSRQGREEPRQQAVDRLPLGRCRRRRS